MINYSVAALFLAKSHKDEEGSLLRGGKQGSCQVDP